MIVATQCGRGGRVLDTPGWQLTRTLYEIGFLRADALGAADGSRRQLSERETLSR